MLSTTARSVNRGRIPEADGCSCCPNWIGWMVGISFWWCTCHTQCERSIFGIAVMRVTFWMYQRMRTVNRPYYSRLRAMFSGCPRRGLVSTICDLLSEMQLRTNLSYKTQLKHTRADLSGQPNVFHNGTTTTLTLRISFFKNRSHFDIFQSSNNNHKLKSNEDRINLICNLR